MTPPIDGKGRWDPVKDGEQNVPSTETRQLCDLFHFYRQVRREEICVSEERNENDEKYLRGGVIKDSRCETFAAPPAPSHFLVFREH